MYLLGQKLHVFVENKKSFDWISWSIRFNNVNPCHAEYLYVLHSSLIIILLTCRIPVVNLYFQSDWKTVRILIGWLRQNPADPDLECFQNRINWASTRTTLSSGGLRTTKARGRPACTSPQTYQRLCYSFFGKYHILTYYKRNCYFLASLCSWGDWFESRFVGNPEDRFCRSEA